MKYLLPGTVPDTGSCALHPLEFAGFMLQMGFVVIHLLSCCFFSSNCHRQHEIDEKNTSWWILYAKEGYGHKPAMGCCVCMHCTRAVPVFWWDMVLSSIHRAVLFSSGQKSFALLVFWLGSCWSYRMVCRNCTSSVGLPPCCSGGGGRNSQLG